MQILGLDHGAKRIGMALADAAVRLARPLGVLKRGSRAEDFARLAAVVREHHVGLIVVGQPLNEDGSAGPKALTVARWAAALAEALGAPPPVQAGAKHGTISAIGDTQVPFVVLWDERLSTVQAMEVHVAQGKRPETARSRIDALAAAVVLQDYLDSRI